MDNLQPAQTTRRSVLPFLMIGGLGVGLIMAVAVIFLGPNRQGSGITLPTPVPDLVVEGQAAPDFEMIMVDGSTASLSEYRGSTVAVNFWATWCAPCRVEMPALQEAHDAGSLVVLAINAGESAEQVEPYLDELGLTFPTILDETGDIVDLYAVRVFPTTVIVGPNGLVIAEVYGPLSAEMIDEYIGQ